MNTPKVTLSVTPAELQVIHAGLDLLKDPSLTLLSNVVKVVNFGQSVAGYRETATELSDMIGLRR